MAEEETTDLVVPEANPDGAEVENDGQSFSDELKSLRDEMITALKQDDDDLAKLLRKRSQEQRQLFIGLHRYSGELLQVAGQYDRIQRLVDLMPDVDVNEANSRGRTALHAAAENGNVATVKTLLQREAKWDVRDDRGMLPLHSALTSRSPNIEVVLLLVERCAHAGSEGSQVSLGVPGRRDWLYGPPDNMGNTPLHVAATNIAAGYEGCLQCVQELKRFDPCAKNKRGDTPLHVAARRGCFPLLEALLKVFYGCEKNVCQHPTNGDGDTLLDIAATSGFDDLAVLLLDYGADPRQGVLFKIVSESARRPGTSKDMRRMFRLIIDNVGKWSNGQDSDEVVGVINNISDQSGGRNVVELAVDEGAVTMLKEIVHTSVLYEFESVGKYRFLVRHCLPSKERISLIERMVSGDRVQVGSQMLSIQPFSFLSSQYLWYSSVVYAIFFVFQLIYMLFFSYFGIPNACRLSDHFQIEAVKCDSNDDGEPTSYSTTIKNTVGFIVWPVFTLIFTICLKLFQLGGSVFVRRCEFVGLAFSLSFGTVVVIWFVALVKADSYELYTAITAFLFILGWLQTFYYLSYLGELYIFTNLVKAIIINDVLKLASILIFVVLGFSFAIHSLEQTGVPSTNRTLTETVYLTFASTLNLGDLFDDTMGDSAFAQVGGNLDLLRVVFIAYLIVAFLILFNVLIAMMSDTYQQNNRNARAVWRYDVLKVSLALIICRRFKVVEPVLPEEVAGPIIRSLPESEEATDDSDAKLLPF